MIKKQPRCLRLAKPKTPITSIAELKKRVGDPKTRDWLCHGGCISEIGDMIDEFEAELRRLHDLGLADADTIKLILGEPVGVKEIFGKEAGT